jgi:NAD(P)-dependent dehydrogenase (short-subunit alcohol dehydrogenase family)
MVFLNAAVFEIDHKASKDGVELMFQVNYLAQFYLARLLMNNLLSSDHSRIVMIACEAHRGGDLTKNSISVNRLNSDKAGFHFLQTYCNTKLCNVLFAHELSRRLNKANASNILF